MTSIMIKRNVAIDFLKFFAVFLVMNSHMRICYPQYDFLATGGAMGDALFFFASGFTLFLGRKMRFDNWYKKRISRIYPSILAASIFALLVWRFKEDFGDVLIGKRYWFIGCILIYYIFLYPVKNFGEGKYAMHLFVIWALIGAMLYFVLFDGFTNFYSGGLYRCFLFFLFMLQGAWMGKQQDSYKFKWIYFVLWIVCSLAWFALFYIGKGNGLFFLSLFPLLGFTRYTYLIFTATCFDKLYKHQICGNIVYVISQLCLEVYLIQKFVFTDKLNFMFPLNIPIIMIAVLLVSYFIKMISEIILQTFRTEPYDWSKVITYKRF